MSSCCFKINTKILVSLPKKYIWLFDNNLLLGGIYSRVLLRYCIYLNIDISLFFSFDGSVIWIPFGETLTETLGNFLEFALATRKIVFIASDVVFSFVAFSTNVLPIYFNWNTDSGSSLFARSSAESRNSFSDSLLCFASAHSSLNSVNYKLFIST